MKNPLSVSTRSPLLRFRLLLLVAAMAAGAGMGLLPGNAQESAPPPAAQSAETAAPPQPKKELTLIQMYQLGGWTMHFLLFGSVAMIGLVIYNAIMIRPARLLGTTTLPSIREAADKMDFPRVLEICAAAPCMFNNVIRAGFERVNEAVSPSAIESGMEEAATEEVQKSMMTISYLSVIAVVAPMIGLLGTVSGMIKAFRAMALGGMGRPELLADNISEALITTAGGLIVGIPAMIFYFFFKSRLLASVATMSRLGGDLVQRVKRALRLFQHGQLTPPPGVIPGSLQAE